MSKSVHAPADTNEVSMSCLAKAFDRHHGRPGAFNEGVKKILAAVDWERLHRITDAFADAADEIELDDEALTSPQAFERLYTRAARHLLAAHYRQPESNIPERRACGEAEHAFRRRFAGGRVEAFDEARRKGLRWVVEFLRDGIRSREVERYLDHLIGEHLRMPRPLQLRLLQCFREGMDFSRILR